MWQNRWHDGHETVVPEPKTDAVRKAREQYPNKRLIVHYLQPHAPYVGPTGTEELHTEYTNFWGTYRRGEAGVPQEIAIEVHRENLILVVPYVDELFSQLKGKRSSRPITVNCSGNGILRFRFGGSAILRAPTCPD